VACHARSVSKFQQSFKQMAKLINIDNGGTLTDICIIEGADIWRTKTLTTAFDLSKCLMDGLRKASALIYGVEDIERLLLSTEHIRYSTTQGTNALVQRQGPRLGLIYGGGVSLQDIRNCNPELFDALIADRMQEISSTRDDGAGDDGAKDDGRFDAVRAVSDLAARGANRIIIAFGGDNHTTDEKLLRSALLRAFPPHLLGAVPLLYSHEIAVDDDDVRRSWTAIFNSFLHPAMERFLYSAEQRLRDARAQRPLLIFRNDGQSARVAKTTAIKTYSSGPRGGADGARMLARHYNFSQLISVDIGGTTTDISMIENGEGRQHARGTIEGVPTSFPLTDVTSVGVGGSSIIKVEGGAIRVGPESVGSTPGPACFGLGGTDATITDAFFASGLLDPKSFFGGAMKIDIERAHSAINKTIAGPLNLNVDAAISAMEDAWVGRVAESIKRDITINPDAVLAAFGGGGPFVMCRIAERLGVNKILIPKLAAVFSAFGIGFSNIGHSFQAPLASLDDRSAVRDNLRKQAERAMRAEGIDPSTCLESVNLIVMKSGIDELLPFESVRAASNEKYAVRVSISSPLPHPELAGTFDTATDTAIASGTRTVLLDGKHHELPLYLANEVKANSKASGPAVLEEEYFTCRIDSGWQFQTNSAGDILITRSAS
jgi:N-methylhydantoinase A